MIEVRIPIPFPSMYWGDRSSGTGTVIWLAFGEKMAETGLPYRVDNGACIFQFDDPAEAALFKLRWA